MFHNLSQMHRFLSEKYGASVALQFKHLGQYRAVSWDEYRQIADYAAQGLILLGVKASNPVAMLSENRHEWLIADHAILSSAAITVPLHAPLTSQQIEYQLAHSETQGIIVSNQHQADKIFAIHDRLPLLQFMISFDEIEIPARVQKLKVVSWKKLLETGETASFEIQTEIRQRESAINPSDLAAIIYTSGTTGHPKGVMLSHNNILSNAQAISEIYEITSSDHLLSWLPYSHIYARTIDHYLTTLAGVTVSLAESPETVIENLSEVQPTWITAVPRFYEKVWASVANLPEHDRKEQLQRIFGDKLEKFTSGGAPLPREICQAMYQSGFPILEGYGLTESSPVICFNTSKHWKIGTVGRAIPGVEVCIADDGEILTRGPHVMEGYWKTPEATAETIKGGWLHTGDIGQLDEEGYLTITDRKKELIVLSNGKNVVPSEIERLLVSDCCIDQAVVYGNNRPYITALIVPNFESLADQIPKNLTSVQQTDNIIRDVQVNDFMSARISVLMEQVSTPEQVKKFYILQHPFTIEAEELTATLKVRRPFIVDKYQSELNDLYDG